MAESKSDDESGLGVLGRLFKDRLARKVVEGAELRCDMGSNTGKLKSREPKTEVVEGHSVCDIMDHEPGISIPSFGVCRVLGGPCVPVTPKPWISPTNVTAPHGSPVLLTTALLPCGVGGIIGVTDHGQSTVYLHALASPAELLQQALALYPEAFAAVARFPSNEQGLDSFLAATSIGVDNVDTDWNETNYNCQGFASALAQSLLESGVAQDARLIHFMAYRNRSFWFDDETVNHAVTEIEMVDGTRYLIDGQTQLRSPGYQLDENGDIPGHIRDGWLLHELSNGRYGGNADYVEFGGPRDVGNAWTPVMNVTTQSDGLNLDRDARHDVDWETEWNPQPGSGSE